MCVESVWREIGVETYLDMTRVENPQQGALIQGLQSSKAPAINVISVSEVYGVLDLSRDERPLFRSNTP